MVPQGLTARYCARDGMELYYRDGAVQYHRGGMVLHNMDGVVLYHRHGMLLLYPLDGRVCGQHGKRSAGTARNCNTWMDGIVSAW